MKNIRKAFTLTEVLIALTVVGIIASITIPSLVKDTQKRITVAILDKAILQVQNGCQSMIQFENETPDNGSYNDKVAYVNFDNGGLLAQNRGIGLYMNAERINAALPILRTYANNGNANNIAAWNNAAVRYAFTKFDAEVGFVMNADLSEEDQNNLEAKVADVYINVNPHASNVNHQPTLGKDVFLYEMQNSCRLIPVGSDNPDLCPNDGGTNCAARIAKDGYRITY